MSIQKYTVKEAINKVLNTNEDALKVDIDNVTLTTEGSDVAIDVALDKANDSVTFFSNTNKDGTSGTSLAPLVDLDGHLQVDILSSASLTVGDGGGSLTVDDGGTTLSIDDGSASITVDTTGTNGLEVVQDTAADLNMTEANSAAIKTAVETIDNAIAGSEMQVDVVASLPAGDNNIGNVDVASAIPAGSNTIGNIKITDGTETANVDSENNLNVVEKNSDAIKTAVQLIDNAISGSEMQVDVVASIPAGTNTIGNVKLTDGSETASVNASNQLETAEANSGDIKTAVETLLFDTGKDDYAHSDSADINLAPYFGIFVGTGGDIRLNTGASGGGSDLLFKNVASGQVLPIKVHRVYSTNTTATDLVFLK
tara:strand:- start:289 stop:1395 length:1107 start_codon:yes stop_codon:yes gene_type:complete